MKTEASDRLTVRPSDALAIPANRGRPVSWNVWVDEPGHSGAWNMAADYQLLLAAQRGEAWLRLYRWDPGCLSFGRNEPALGRYYRDRVARLGLDTVRRPTGGRAVWHDAEVTYAVASPIETFGSLADTYAAIHQALARGLRRLDIDAQVAPRPSGGHAGVSLGPCFASPAGGEVVVGARKLVGSAQVREGQAFLQHGSILLADRQDIVSSVTRGPRVPVLATSINALLHRTVSFGEVCRAVIEAPGAVWSEGSASEGHEPDRSQVERFADPGWTWRR